MMDEFNVVSEVGKGTTIDGQMGARIVKTAGSNGQSTGRGNTGAPGVVGDGHFVETTTGWLLAVADRLGLDRRRRSPAAFVEVLQHIEESPVALLRLCHEALKNTRGSARALSPSTGGAVCSAGPGSAMWKGDPSCPSCRIAREYITCAAASSATGFPVCTFNLQLPMAISWSGDDGIDGDLSRPSGCRKLPKLAGYILAHFAKPTDDALSRWPAGVSLNSAGSESIVALHCRPQSAVRNCYQRALRITRSTENAKTLMCAYELGRRAVAEQRNILDLVAMHQSIMWTAVLSKAAEKQMGVYFRRGQEFLAEVLAPFEMMHRGFADSIRQLQEANATLEQRVDERTLALRESQRNTADLARLYLILSSINSAIVRLHDREELFKEACRIAVHQGGYPVAWVTCAMRPRRTPSIPGVISVAKAPQRDCPGRFDLRGGPQFHQPVYDEGMPPVRHRETLIRQRTVRHRLSAFGLLPLKLADG
jgi:hypothetical protein